MLLFWSSVGSISMVSTRPVQVWDSSTREVDDHRLALVQAAQVQLADGPLYPELPEDRILIKGRGRPVMSVPPFRFTSFTTPSTSE